MSGQFDPCGPYLQILNPPVENMKINKTLIAFLVASLLTVGLAFAGEAKAAAAKVAGCCAKAAKENKACTHGECCVAAAKAGNNCEKCGGSGKAEVKKADAKK